MKMNWVTQNTTKRPGSGIKKYSEKKKLNDIRDGGWAEERGSKETKNTTTNPSKDSINTVEDTKKKNKKNETRQTSRKNKSKT